MPTLAIPTIKWGKHKERSVLCKIFTIDGRLVEKDLPALSTSLDDKEIGLAWLINQDSMLKGEDGVWRQFISEKTQIPLSLENQLSGFESKDTDKEMKTLSDSAFGVSFQQKQMEAIQKAKANEVWNRFLWIVSIVFGSLIIIAGIVQLGG